MLGYSPWFVLPPQPPSKICGGSASSLFLRCKSYAKMGVGAGLRPPSPSVDRPIQVVFPALSDHWSRIPVSAYPVRLPFVFCFNHYQKHVFSILVNRNACDGFFLPPILIRPSLYPVALTLPPTRSDSRNHTGHLENMANFQETNPKPWFVCVFFSFNPMWHCNNFFRQILR